MDYGEVMLHIFHEQKRGVYALEDLWSDAKLTRHNDTDKAKGLGFAYMHLAAVEGITRSRRRIAEKLHNPRRGMHLRRHANLGHG